MPTKTRKTARGIRLSAVATQYVKKQLCDRAGALAAAGVHIANTAAFRRLVDTGMDDAQSHFPSGFTYRWAMWTGDISNVFDKINHAEILTAWAISSVGGWSGKRMVD